jgi:hypothetical protein
MCSVRGHLLPHPPRDFTPTPLAPRKSAAAVDDLIAVAAGEDSSRHGGEVAVATRVWEGLDISSVDSSDDEVVSVHSVHSVPLYGVGVCDDSPNFCEHYDQMPDSPTDNEVSKYSFYSHLSHYMEGHKISKSNRDAVELCLLSEAGAFVRNIDPMKKDKKESAFFAKYLSIIDEIEDDQFKNAETVRENMCRMYKGAKEIKFSEESVAEIRRRLTCLRTFAKKIPGIGNLAELPSGSTQLRHMKMPLVQSLWKEKYPVRYLFNLSYDCTSTIDNSPPIRHQNKDDVDYDDPFSVQSKIEDSWWLTHQS